MKDWFARLAAILLLVPAKHAVAADSPTLPAQTPVRDWPALPSGFKLGQPSGVGVDSHDNVLIFHRGDRTWTTPFPTNPVAAPTVLILNGSKGELLSSWGAGLFIMPHGLSVDKDDNVWLTDVGRHQVFKFTHEGKLLLTLGERGVPGADKGHFNLPTDVAVLPDGSFYVSDGYQNTRVMKFDASGRYEFEWGGKGVAPGKFNLPHGVVLDVQQRVIVCDRTNGRLQLFDLTGKFLMEWKGPDIGRPYGVTADRNGHVFVADGGNLPGAVAGSRGVELDTTGKAVRFFVAERSGSGRIGLAHDIAVARDGSVYLADSGTKRVLKFKGN